MPLFRKLRFAVRDCLGPGRTAITLSQATGLSRNYLEDCLCDNKGFTNKDKRSILSALGKDEGEAERLFPVWGEEIA